VTGAAASGYAPLTGENNNASFQKEGAAWTDSQGRVNTAFFRPVSANYFRAMGIPLLRGREIDARDVQDAMPVALINETMAKRYWPEDEPIGRRFRTSAQMPWRTIVGVVGDVKYQGLSEPTIPEMYFAYGQALWPQHAMTVVVRTTMRPTDLVAAVRREVASLDSNLPIYDVRTMDQWIERSLAAPRFNVVLFGTFAALALILAAVGIYGVVAHSVTQRTRELGLRLAVGAEPRHVMAMVLRESLVVVAIGMAVGLATALIAVRGLSGLLFDIGPLDPPTWIGVVGLLLAWRSSPATFPQDVPCAPIPCWRYGPSRTQSCGLSETLVPDLQQLLELLEWTALLAGFGEALGLISWLSRGSGALQPGALLRAQVVVGSARAARQAGQAAATRATTATSATTLATVRASRGETLYNRPCKTRATAIPPASPSAAPSPVSTQPSRVTNRRMPAADAPNAR
jgi:hypothetical protein